jgi:hypothetical protein
MLGISTETARLHSAPIDHVLRALPEVVQALSDDLGRVSVDMCSVILAGLQIREHDQWHDMVTGNESWFYLENVGDRLLVFSNENAPDYPNTTIATNKLLLVSRRTLLHFTS